jgi:hypothetical protein
MMPRGCLRRLVDASSVAGMNGNALGRAWRDLEMLAPRSEPRAEST